MPWGGSSPRRPTASPWSYRLWWRSKMGRAAKRPSLWGTLGLALFAVVLVLLYWYAPALPEMARDYAREAFRLVGLGVAIPAFLLLVLLILWRLGRLSFIWRRRWLALLAFSLAGWGIAILTNPTYAGEWGPVIFGPPTSLQLFRLAVLFYLGLFIWAPRLTLRATRRVLLLIERPFLFPLRLRLRRPGPAEAPVDPPRIKEEEEAPPQQPPKPSPPPAPARLKKVVMEVWRKRGPPPVPVQPILP